jgi:hypothetical protein
MKIFRTTIFFNRSEPTSFPNFLKAVGMYKPFSGKLKENFKFCAQASFIFENKIS